ncbi:ABC transporter permease subunit [Cellulosimicrobium terreum]|nr:ABC transporter permease subunit [Cellulosimicrobium terreum]
MSRLLRVELRRLRARRLVRWATAGTIALALLTVVLAFTQSLPTSDAELAQAEESYQWALDDWERNGDDIVAECEEMEAGDPTGADYGCDQITAPTLENFLAPVPTFEGDDEIWPASGRSTVAGFAPMLVLFALLVGVTFVTAEISTGAIGLWLTFEPRRQRVYWSKATAAMVGVLPVVAISYLVMAGGAYGAYALNGQIGDVTGETWSVLGAVGGRVLVAAAGVAAVGVALGTVLKNAAAALGAVVVWVGVLENVVAATLPELQRWLVRTNLAAWTDGGTSYWVNRCTSDPTGGMTCDSVERAVSQTQGAVFLLGVAVVLSLLAVLVFRRRDVS